MKRKILKEMARRRGFLLEKEIPKEADKTVAMIEYKGFVAMVPVESLRDGSYRSEFIKQTGVPLPETDIPETLPEFFCPNVHQTQEIRP